MPFQKIKNALGFSTEQKALTLTDPDALTLFGAIPTTTGLSIGPGNAMRVLAVACAVSLISETIGALPVKLYDRDTKDALTDHPASSIWLLVSVLSVLSCGATRPPALSREYRC